MHDVAWASGVDWRMFWCSFSGPKKASKVGRYMELLCCLPWVDYQVVFVGARSHWATACGGALRCKRVDTAINISKYRGLASAIAMRWGFSKIKPQWHPPDGSKPLPVPFATNLHNSLSILGASSCRLGGPPRPNIGAHFGAQFRYQNVSQGSAFGPHFGYQK